MAERLSFLWRLNLGRRFDNISRKWGHSFLYNMVRDVSKRHRHVYLPSIYATDIYYNAIKQPEIQTPSAFTKNSNNMFDVCVKTRLCLLSAAPLGFFVISHALFMCV